MTHLIKYYFNAYGHNAPAYGCNMPGDNTGHFYRSADADDLVAELCEALEACLDWIDAVPIDTPLPAMPGFDRDWVESIRDKGRGEK